MAGCNHLIGGAVAVLGNVEQHRVGGGGIVLGLGDVVVFTAPEEDDTISVLLNTDGFVKVAKKRAFLAAALFHIVGEGDDRVLSSLASSLWLRLMMPTSCSQLPSAPPRICCL